MKVDLKRKEKIEKVIEFAERMKRVQDEAEAALKRAQEGINRQAGRKRKKVEIQKVEDRVILDTIDLVFKEQLAKKLADQYMGPCTMNEVISTNVVKL